MQFTRNKGTSKTPVTASLAPLPPPELYTAVLHLGLPLHALEVLTGNMFEMKLNHSCPISPSPGQVMVPLSYPARARRVILYFFAPGLHIQSGTQILSQELSPSVFPNFPIPTASALTGSHIFSCCRWFPCTQSHPLQSSLHRKDAFWYVLSSLSSF